MANVSPAKLCTEEGCQTQCRFGQPGGKRQRCADHKLPGMVNLNIKSCTEEGCQTQCRFGQPGGKRQRCADQKLPGMVDLSHKLCREEGCRSCAAVGYDQGKPIRCTTHRLPGMRYVVGRVCATEGCDTQLSTHNEHDKCALCRAYQRWHPERNEPKPRYRSREQLVVDFVQASILPRLRHVDMVTAFDEMIKGGCSLRRPDVLLDFPTHPVIIECDENQHRRYLCEEKRAMEIFRDLGFRPIVFIRFNPDAYTDAQGVKHVCFKWTKAGTLVVHDKAAWEARLAVLCDKVLEYAPPNYPPATPPRDVIEERLFYDEPV